MFYLLYIQRRKGPSIPHPNKYLKHMHSLRAHGGHSFIHSEKRYSKAVWLLSIVRAYCHLVAKLCLTLATPWTVAHQAPLCMGFSRQEHWSGLPCPPPQDLPDPGIEPASLTCPLLAGEFFIPLGPPGKPPRKHAVSLRDGGLRFILIPTAAPNEPAGKQSSPERLPSSTADPNFIFLHAPRASSIEKSESAETLICPFLSVSYKN